MTTQKVQLNQQIKKDSTKHEHIYQNLNNQIKEKEEEISELRRQLNQSAVDHAAKVGG